MRLFALDISTHAYGVSDLRGHDFVHGYWHNLAPWHINLWKFSAAMDTIRAMAHRGDLVKMLVNNIVALSDLTKQGGKKLEINRLTRPSLLCAMENYVTLQLEWVLLQDMPANHLSRCDFNVSELELKKGIYLCIERILWHLCQSTHDMCASPHTVKKRLFVTRWPHAKVTAVDASYCPLQQIKMCHACGPLAMIPAWIQRLRDNQSIVCLMVAPMWDCSPWWHSLMRMHVKPSPLVVLNPVKGLLNGCQGTPMNAPGWPPSCVVVSGQHSHNKASKPRQLRNNL